MNELNELIRLSKFGLFIFVNEHLHVDDTIIHTLDEDEDLPYIPEEILEQMICKNTMVSIQAYVDIQGIFIHVHHYDMDLAVKEALQEVKNWFDKN